MLTENELLHVIDFIDEKIREKVKLKDSEVSTYYDDIIKSDMLTNPAWDNLIELKSLIEVRKIFISELLTIHGIFKA